MRHHPFPIMESCYCIAFSINGNAPVRCPIITANHPLGIDECGQCCADKADAILSLSSDNELVIEKTEHAEISITRSGRNYYLNPSKAIRIFRNDRITIGNSCIEIVSISHINRQYEPTLSHRNASYISSTRTYLRILSTIAAIFTICAVHSHAYGQTPDTNALQNLRCTEPTTIHRMILNNLNPQTPQIAQPQNNTRECEEGKEICLSENRYACVKRLWKKIESCQRPAHCYGDYDTNTTYCEGGGPCKDGQYTCDSDEIYKCIDGKWALHKKCESPMKCRFPAPGFFDLLTEPEPDCVKVDVNRLTGAIATGEECEDNQMKCESNAVMRCSYGFWQYNEICEDNMKCEMISVQKAKCVKVEP